jgi:hypothetical protein
MRGKRRRRTLCDIYDEQELGLGMAMADERGKKEARDNRRINYFERKNSATNASNEPLIDCRRREFGEAPFGAADPGILRVLCTKF